MTKAALTKPTPVTPAEFAGMPGVAGCAGEKAIAVALSGGPDSMALCWLLSRWAADHGGPAIHALTVDHGLRRESAAEAKQAGARVGDWPCVHHHVLTLKGLKGKTRIMERAREGRYDLMAAWCRRKSIGQLFTAHHMDDQAETFLFRLARGSGPDGLAGMRAVYAYDDRLILARPLLDVPKDRLVATCRRHKIPFVNDPTNESTDFARNRLRKARAVLEHEGLSVKRLAVTAARMRRATEALEYYARALYAQALRDETARRMAFDAAVLAQAPAEIRLRVLLLAMRGEGGYGPRRERLEELAADLFADGDFRKRTLGGFVVSRDRAKGLIILQKEGQ